MVIKQYRWDQGKYVGQEMCTVPDGLCPMALERLQQEKGYEPGTRHTAKAFSPETPSVTLLMPASSPG